MNQKSRRVRMQPAVDWVSPFKKRGFATVGEACPRAGLPRAVQADAL
jgi:hypothetical protein